MTKQTKNNLKGLSYRVNDEIYGYDSVRIVGENIESNVVSLKEAKRLAETMEMDLIEINPKANPPIMRIGNYEKIILTKMLFQSMFVRKKKKNKHHICHCLAQNIQLINWF